MSTAHSENARAEPGAPAGASLTSPVSPVGPAVGALGLLAVFLVGMTGTMITAVKPILVAAYVSTLGLDEPRAGALVGLDMAALSIGSVLVSWRLYRLPRSSVALGALALIAAGNGLSMIFDSFGALVGARAVAGLGSGIAAGLAAATLTNMPHSASRFGLYLIVTAAGAALVAWLSGALLETNGAAAMFTLLAVLVLPAAVLVRRLPSYSESPIQGRAAADSSGSLRWAVVALLAGTVVYYVAAGGTWAFIGQIGAQRDLSATAIGAALGGSLIAGALGALVPFAARERFGLATPIVASVAITVGSLATLAYAPGIVGFVAGACAFMFAWLAFFPFVMGLCTRVDPSGRLGALCYGVSAGAQSLGPALAGVIIAKAGVGTWFGTATAGIVLGAAVLMLAVVHGREVR